MSQLFPTALVGSYPQPDWLIDRAGFTGRMPPRVRAKELWRVAPEHLAEALDDATLVAIRAQEEAGLDIVTDGEIRRESYSNHFATALDGVDVDNPGTAPNRSGEPIPVPRIVGPIRRSDPIEVDDVRFLRAHTERSSRSENRPRRTVKMTVPGPFTMSQQAQNDVLVELDARRARGGLGHRAQAGAPLGDPTVVITVDQVGGAEAGHPLRVLRRSAASWRGAASCGAPSAAVRPTGRRYPGPSRVGRISALSADSPPHGCPGYGEVVDSVNVSVLP